MPAGRTGRAVPASRADLGSVWSPRHRVTSIAIVTVVLLDAFEVYAVVTAMPVAARALGGVREYGLAFSLFMTTSLFGVVLAGGWNDRRGPAGPMLAGLATFASGLVLCGLAGSFAVLLAGRAVSGLGAGLEMVSLYVLVAGAYPTALQPQVFGLISAAWVLPSLVGPPIAGFLATQVSWRAVFLAVPPLVALPAPVLVTRLRALRPRQVPVDSAAARAPAPRGRVLVARGGVLAAAAAVLQWGLHGAGRLPGPVVAAAGAALVLAALPGLVPAGVFRLRRGLAALVAFRSMVNAAFFGSEVFVPLMLVELRGLTPARAGLVLTAGAVGWFTGSWTQGRPGLRVERTVLVVVGGTALGLGVLALTAAPLLAVPVVVMALAWAVAGLGMGWSMSCSSVLLLRLSAEGEQGRNASAMQIGDLLGSVLGIGAAGALFAAWHDPTGDDSQVYALIWAALGVLGLLSALGGVRIRVSDRP